ncbi:hypothetical protein OG948_57780 (plasmid) [Embleya sp. NBC_00888]|uniref:hypothetical protein n=1 Tax=Embleya sp. NBC_00888 TaxID=2975960 RepID=UPI002F90C7A5|nr:hypothetical protein OG948_57780 [Embleya sp. NBC_00888]
MRHSDPPPKADADADADALAALVAQARPWSDPQPPLPDRGRTFPHALAEAIGDRLRRPTSHLRAIRARRHPTRDAQGSLDRP